MFSVFLGLFQPILTLIEATMVFFNFFKFFPIFWNFQLRFRLERNRTIIFIFSLSRPFPTYFCLKTSYNGIFLYFEFFCYFFRIWYYASGRNRTERQYLFSLFLILFKPILASNEAIMVFYNFLNFFGIFYYVSCMTGTRQNDNIYFLSFSAFPPLFWPEMKP